MAIGASFCHVRRIIPDDSVTPCVTSGTQKWNGVIPSFIASARRIIEGVKRLLVFVDHWPVCMVLMMTAIISSIDAVVWVRKYLVAASVDRGIAFLIRIGVIASIFISRPTQISSQWELMVVRIVPVKRVR